MIENRYTAAGGVVVDGSRVLVLLRPKRGEVRLPKGHVHEGEAFSAAALREVEEESGYRGLRVVCDLGSQTVDFVHDGVRVVREERFFLMVRQDGDEMVEYEEQFRPTWVGWDEAVRLLTFEGEREWVRRAREKMDVEPE